MNKLIMAFILTSVQLQATQYTDSSYDQNQSYQNRSMSQTQQSNVNTPSSAYTPDQTASYPSSYKTSSYKESSSTSYGVDKSSQSGRDSQSSRDTAGNERDREINRKIRDKLSGWFTSGYNDTLILRTNNGVVVVEGTVTDQSDINKIGDKVKDVEGVRSVNLRLNVRDKHDSTDRSRSGGRETSANKGQADTKEGFYANDFAATENDRQLNMRIRNKLSGWFSSGYNDTIILKTSNGNVTLEGHVARQEDLHRIMDILNRIEGVKSVNNRVKVTPDHMKS